MQLFPDSHVDTLHLPQAHELDPVVLRFLLSELDRRLDQFPHDVALLSRRMSLLRAVGDLPEAASAAARLLAVRPDHPAARRTHMILTGQPGESSALYGPAPFLRLTDVFTADERVGLWDAVGQEDEGGIPAMIFDAGNQLVVDPDVRLAYRYRLLPDLRTWFIDRLTGLMDRTDAFRRIGMQPFQPDRIETQITRYSEAGHFNIHRDSGSAVPERRLTFVYYFHHQPRRFRGGDLLLFDEPDHRPSSKLTEFTRIQPDDNSLILFPSDRLHAVMPVALSSDDLMDGRWTINGWLYCTKH